MNEKLRAMEADLTNKMKEQREGMMQIFANFDEEKTRLIKNGGANREETTAMMRSVMSQIERKVEEEINNRQRDLGETKDALEQKLINLLDKLKNDERQGLERERRLMEQV